MPFALTTTAFQPGGDIPRKFTCQGADLSPALAWTDAPAGAQSFALIVDDPHFHTGMRLTGRANGNARVILQAR